MLCVANTFALSKAQLKQIDIKPQMTRIYSGGYMSLRRYKVKMYAYLPEKDKATGSACIVLPGGSYIYMGIYREGHDIGKWLASEGVAAFVLSYRTAMQLNHHPAMIQDVQRAMYLVKSNAQSYNIDANKVGVMGFSAGGHLAGFLAQNYTVNYLESMNITGDYRPAFACMVYPVVSMSEDCTHIRSRKHLLGKYRNDSDMRLFMSLEKNVSSNMCPVFLVQCKEDHTVDFHNALLLDAALTQAKVSHEFLLYDEEGHGFGADPNKYKGNTAWSWSEAFIPWLKSTLSLQ